MPIIEQVKKDRRKPESCFLNKFSGNKTSQAGEDGILAKLFEIIAIESRWCVEFGAWDGKKYSNTYELIANQGWSGVLIEGSEEKFAELLKTYAGNDKAVCVNGMVLPHKGHDSLESHLERTPLPKRFDLLSIDVDGNDYHIWESMETYEPRVVVIEFNPTIPSDIVFVQDADISINQGCSLRALVELGKRKGYELACATTLNGIFVRSDEFGKLGIADNDIEAMARQAFDAKFFQGYDGTLYTFGLPKLMWRGGVPIAPDALQILKPEDRFYKGSPLRKKVPTAPA